MTSPQQTPKAKRRALIGALCIVAIVIIILVSAFWYVSEALHKQTRALDAGCTIESFNQFGLATSYMCPEGYEVK